MIQYVAMTTVLFFVYSNKYICANRIEGARRYADQHGWRIQVIERHSEVRPIDVKGVIDFWKPVGIIAECAGGIPEISHKAVGSIPLVYLDEDPNSEKGRGFFVNSNSTRIGEIAARELLSIGLPHYAFVGWLKRRYWSEDRRVAFERIVAAHGKSCHSFTAPVSGASRRKMLRKWLKTLPKPCGLFAVHDPVAEEILELAAIEGIAVPDEISVIGVDDDPVICERTSPTLTSIRLDFSAGGYLCAEILGRAIADRRLPSVRLNYEPMYVAHRLSTCLVTNVSPRVRKAVEYIRIHAEDIVDVAAVVSEMGCSRRLAELRFREETGHTIYDEILSVRMERVENLLRNPLCKIDTIAATCGWASNAALRTIFKRRHGGLSMSEWRERNAKA